MHLHDVLSGAHGWATWFGEAVQGMVGRRESSSYGGSVGDGSNVFRAAFRESGTMIRKRRFHQLLQANLSGWPLRPLRFSFGLGKKSKF